MYLDRRSEGLLVFCGCPWLSESGLGRRASSWMILMRWNLVMKHGMSLRMNSMNEGLVGGALQSCLPMLDDWYCRTSCREDRGEMEDIMMIYKKNNVQKKPKISE